MKIRVVIKDVKVSSFYLLNQQPREFYSKCLPSNRVSKNPPHTQTIFRGGWDFGGCPQKLGTVSTPGGWDSPQPPGAGRAPSSNHRRIGGRGAAPGGWRPDPVGSGTDGRNFLSQVFSLKLWQFVYFIPIFAM